LAIITSKRCRVKSASNGKNCRATWSVFALLVARLSGFPPRLRTVLTGLQLATTIMDLDTAQSLGNPPIAGLRQELRNGLLNFEL
jgi:hypothetical protein